MVYPSTAVIVMLPEPDLSLVHSDLLPTCPSGPVIVETIVVSCSSHGLQLLLYFRFTIWFHTTSFGALMVVLRSTVITAGAVAQSIRYPASSITMSISKKRSVFFIIVRFSSKL